MLSTFFNNTGYSYSLFLYLTLHALKGIKVVKQIGYFLLLLNVFCLSACDDESGDDLLDSAVFQDDDLSSCYGFRSPGINILVLDSFGRELLLYDAVVRVYSKDEDNEIVEDAVFTSIDDSISDSEVGAYYTSLNLNSLNFEISIVVMLDGYHSAVVKGIPFSTDTSCSANNTITQEIYVCPADSSCL